MPNTTFCTHTFDVSTLIWWHHQNDGYWWKSCQTWLLDHLWPTPLPCSPLWQLLLWEEPGLPTGSPLPNWFEWPLSFWPRERREFQTLDRRYIGPWGMLMLLGLLLMMDSLIPCMWQSATRPHILPICDMVSHGCMFHYGRLVLGGIKVFPLLLGEGSGVGNFLCFCLEFVLLYI